jgi:uncharacterized protein (TIGR02466 family)
MEIASIFATPIASDSLDLDNKLLEEFCKKSVKGNFDAPVMEQNQSRFLDMSSPELQPLLQAVYDRFNTFYKAMDLNKNTKLDILRSWTNVDNCYPIDVPHIHPDAVFSAVYYVKGSGTSENGNLVLHSPVAALQHCINPSIIEKNNNFNCFGHEINPLTGRLVIFPAWIMHNVQRNYLATERISIAFDAMIVNC